MSPPGKRFVYLLRSFDGADRPCVGLTSDVPARLGIQNAGLSPHTAKYGRGNWSSRLSSQTNSEPSGSRSISSPALAARSRSGTLA